LVVIQHGMMPPPLMVPGHPPFAVQAPDELDWQELNNVPGALSVQLPPVLGQVRANGSQVLPEFAFARRSRPPGRKPIHSKA